MAKNNYSYQKYQKELAKKKKKEEKRLGKLERKNLQAKTDSEQVSDDGVAAQDQMST